MFSGMSKKIEDLTLEILKRIQSQLSDHTVRFDRLEGRLGVIESRMGTLEDLVRKQRRDTAGLLVMAKSVTGDFAEQVAAIEERVAALEAKGTR